MKSVGLEELIKKIFSDEKSQEKFKLNPEGFLSRYKLSSREKKAVLSAHARLGLMTNNSQQIEEDVGPFSTWF